MPDLGDHAFDNRIADMTGKTWAYEDFVEGASLDLGTKHVSAAEIIEFASEFDAQPMHLDEAAGKASILGGLSASGWHTCAMTMSMFVAEMAVLAGDTLSGKLTILGKRQSRSRPEVGLVSMRAELFNQHGENVFELENTAMFLTREAAA